jgi:cysteine desulfurase
MSPRIYLDNNASTAVDPRVLKAVIACLESCVGNSSSTHSFGQEVRNLLNKSRRSVAEYLGVKPAELIFTSGGSEGINMAIKGVCTGKMGHIITSNVEHNAVHNTVSYFERGGWAVTWLSTGLLGAVTPSQVREAIRSDTRLIVLTAANNETGVKTDIEAIAAIAQEANIPLVVDGVALLGKEPITIPAGISVICFSGHKIHAPKGVGAVFIRQNLKLDPLIIGAHQENNRRAGSENIPGIVGLAEAVAILKEDPESYLEVRRLRDLFEAKLTALLPSIIINGAGERVANTSNITFPGADGEALLMQLDRHGIAASHGAACISGALEPSRVLLNMGISRNLVRSTLRFSLSRFTTEAEVLAVVEVVKALLSK